MTVVERVDASVDFKFADNGKCTVKQMEEYLFAARMRGALDDSAISFVIYKDYNTYREIVKSMSVAVPAEMGGYPVLAPVSNRKRATYVGIACVSAPLLLIALLLMVLL